MRCLSGAFAAAAALALALWLASPALGAFPGANGLLAVQPRSGRGIVLVSASGHGQRRICVRKAACGTPKRPRWSPDGRSLVFAGPAIRIVYPDGSCLNCQFGRAANPAFEPIGTAISFVEDRLVSVDKIDGNREAYRHPGGIASDEVWSASGRIAVVRAGAIWAGRPGHLVRLAAGSQPSWAPNGAAIAASQDGWIVVIGVGDRRLRRLVRGSAPPSRPTAG